MLSHHPIYIPTQKGWNLYLLIFRSYYTYSSSSYKILDYELYCRALKKPPLCKVSVCLDHHILSLIPPPFSICFAFYRSSLFLQHHPSFPQYFCVYVTLILKSMLTLYVLQTWVVISLRTKRTSASTNNTPSDPERAISKRRGH